MIDRVRAWQLWAKITAGVVGGIVLLGLLLPSEDETSPPVTTKTVTVNAEDAPSPVRVSITGPGHQSSSDGDLEAWGARTPSRRSTITGNVRPPGAQLEIDPPFGSDPRPVEVAPDGRFEVRVALKRGDNDFRLTASEQDQDHVVLITIRRTATAAERQRAQAREREREAAERARERERRAAERAALTQTFSGNGGKNLGTLRVKEESVLRWRNDGGLFTLMDEEAGLFVNSQASSGDTVVDAGTYRRVEVNAIGNWTITITPR